MCRILNLLIRLLMSNSNSTSWTSGTSRTPLVVSLATSHLTLKSIGCLTSYLVDIMLVWTVLSNQSSMIRFHLTARSIPAQCTKSRKQRRTKTSSGRWTPASNTYSKNTTRMNIFATRFNARRIRKITQRRATQIRMLVRTTTECAKRKMNRWLRWLTGKKREPRVLTRCSEWCAMNKMLISQTSQCSMWRLQMRNEDAYKLLLRLKWRPSKMNPITHGACSHLTSQLVSKFSEVDNRSSNLSLKQNDSLMK